jgi:hypothetical protein
MSNEWMVGWVECHQCRYRWVAIIKPGGTFDALECPECDEMDGWLVKRIDPPDAAELRTWDRDSRDQYLEESARVAMKYGYEVF